MDKYGFLSGEQLVAKGVLKLDCTLPELGLKDVSPNGSWLEQKQIQSALEARKHLVELQRIEKCGSISHAVWKEELNLAEVLKKVGGHWQYVGHNIGKHLYLYPEEALFLMESNCLQLKHNDITVSLQKAYSLLLRDETAMMLYKVYSNLSRLGYKVLKFKENNVKDCIIKDSNSTSYVQCREEVASEEINENVSNSHSDTVEIILEDTSKVNTTTNDACNSDTAMEVDNNANSDNEELVTEMSTNDDSSSHDKVIGSTNTVNNIDGDDKVSASSSQKVLPNIYNVLQRLKIRQSKNKCVHAKSYHNIVDLFNKSTFTINTPQSIFLPKNIVLNNHSNTVNIENIKKNRARSNSTESKSYSSSDEVNESHVRRILNAGDHIESSMSRDCPRTSTNEWRNTTNNSQRWQNTSTSHEFRTNARNHIWNQYNQRWNTNPPGFPRFPPHPNFMGSFMRTQFNFCRQQVNFPQLLIFQRFLTANTNYQYPHTSSYRLPNFNNAFPNNNRRKRRRDSVQKEHLLQAIKRTTNRLKLMFIHGNTQIACVQALQRLISTYNSKFHARLRVTDRFEIYDNEIILDTIELEDDESPDRKKPHLDKYEENFKSIKQLALKLKELESKNESTSRHRRALSKVVKTFNKSFNADIYINSNTEIIDRRFITLDSSSDSDCIIEETPNTEALKNDSSKMLKNPFSIFKSLAKSHLITTSDKCSPQTTTDNTENVNGEEKIQNNIMSDIFKGWLPSEDDFGSPEIATKKLMISRLIDVKKEEFLFDYMKSQPDSFVNWLDVKVRFWENLKEITDLCENESKQENESLSKCIVKPEDCTDIGKVLEKLRIIKHCTERDSGTKLSIHFDVYNRDVKNFRKTDPPIPHFRIICINESSSIPPSEDIAGLHGSREDNVGLLFAVVGPASLSYLQVKPVDLPVYLPTSETNSD